MSVRRWLSLAVLVSILALLFGPNLVQGNHVLRAFQTAAVWPRPGGMIDASRELSEVLRLDDSEDNILSDVGAAGFSKTYETTGKVEGIDSHPQWDRLLELRRVDQWWNIVFTDEYRLLLGFKNDRLVWLAAHISVAGLGTI
ncbi:MAG: hypothetical protein HY834_03715 [Devosia nanyangense]|uniref:Uncharacterized protein n=1 Tax=Devosia nanyangense TaxID=1228055 RepID=A0A933L1I7_9HYPH|nr:hypothetical protein [Devosia nanyangense]